MAENELLDIASGRRWAETRSDIRTGMSPVVIAKHAVEELNRGLRSSLSWTFRNNGETLLSLVGALGHGKEAHRAAVLKFKDRWLARMVVSLALKLPGAQNKQVLIRSLATVIIEIAGMLEADDYSTDIFVQPPRAGSDADYLRMYIDEACAWLNGDPRAYRRLSTHLRLTGIPCQEDENIVRLYTEHSREVARIFHNVGSV